MSVPARQSAVLALCVAVPAKSRVDTKSLARKRKNRPASDGDSVSRTGSARAHTKSGASSFAAQWACEPALNEPVQDSSFLVD